MNTTKQTQHTQPRTAIHECRVVDTKETGPHLYECTVCGGRFDLRMQRGPRSSNAQ